MLARWLGDKNGTAAVEMALVAPVLAIVVAGIATYAPELAVVHAMHDAVSTGAQYVMTGGTDATSINTVTTTAWTGKQSSDTVAVAQWCSCAGATNSCTTLCADASVPLGWTQITASTVYVSPTGNQTLTSTQLIRTR
ncbi:MAG TPA: TadE/TadG family type IV pilus assembly protein [Caulobacteraceae bacterium]